MAAHVGVPGVRVHHVRTGAGAGHRQVHAERADRAVGVRQLREVGVRRGAGLVARRTEGMHAGVHVVAGAQRADQLRHVDTGTAVDLRRVLLAEDVDAHEVKLLAPGDGWDLSARCRDGYVRFMSRTSGRKNVLAIVLAGGEGKRLMPLTADRAKPAVPFGGIYRLIDFALSNVVNSGYLKVVVLTQYKSHSLDRHITTTWRMSTLLGNYVTPGAGPAARGQAVVRSAARTRSSSRSTCSPTRSRTSWSSSVPTTSTGWTSRRWSTRTSSPASAHRRGDPAADLDGRPVRRHRRRPDEPRQDPGVPREADRPGRACRTRPTRCSRRWATTSSTPTRCATR